MILKKSSLVTAGHLNRETVSGRGNIVGLSKEVKKAQKQLTNAFCAVGQMTKCEFKRTCSKN